jgi:hypothetical protein
MAPSVSRSGYAFASVSHLTVENQRRRYGLSRTGSRLTRQVVLDETIAEVEARM